MSVCSYLIYINTFIWYFDNLFTPFCSSFLVAVSSSYCAIVAFLLIFTVSNPPETSALPRHLYGRHLILQHRHHVHQRAVEEKMIKVHAQPPKGEKCNGTRFSITSDQIMKAKTVANETQAGILALLENYVSNLLECCNEGAIGWSTHW